MPDAIQLTYLMCSRLCHDLAAPLSAISIGLDMLPETEDPDAPQKILQSSVKAAINKLELLRCLAGYTTDPEKPTFTEAVRIINKSIDLEKYHIDWLCPIEDTISGSAVRLLLAIILIAIDALPRGGKITIHPDFSIELTGSYVKLNEETSQALSPKVEMQSLTSRGIIGYLATLLSQQLDITITYSFPQPNQLIFNFN